MPPCYSIQTIEYSDNGTYISQNISGDKYPEYPDNPEKNTIQGDIGEQDGFCQNSTYNFQNNSTYEQRIDKIYRTGDNMKVRNAARNRDLQGWQEWEDETSVAQ